MCSVLSSLACVFEKIGLDRVFFFQTTLSKLVRLMNMDSKSRKEY